MFCRACLTKQGINDDWCTWGYSIILGKQWWLHSNNPWATTTGTTFTIVYHYRCNTLSMWTATLKIRMCHFTIHHGTGKDMFLVTASWPTVCWFSVDLLLKTVCTVCITTRYSSTSDLGEGNLAPVWGIIPVIVSSGWENSTSNQNWDNPSTIQSGNAPNASVLGNNCAKTFIRWMWSSTTCNFYIILRPVITGRRRPLHHWKSPMDKVFKRKWIQVPGNVEINC